MRARGVTKVLYLGYYYTKDSLISGNLSALKQAIDYGDGKFATACANSLLSCTFIDPRSSVKPADIIADGIHPATSGSQKIANLIWPHLAPRL
jgi:lysophospholipase L1-like esterase